MAFSRMVSLSPRIPAVPFGTTLSGRAGAAMSKLLTARAKSSHSLASHLVQAQPGSEGGVDLTFNDGAAFRFHSLWLRDACRDANHVSVTAGERILGNTLLVKGFADDFHATSTSTTPDGDLDLKFSDGSSGHFDAQFLRSYADAVASPLPSKGMQRQPLVDTEWLKPYIDLKGPAKSQMNLWTTDTGPEFREMTLEEASTSMGNLQMIQTLLRDGAVKITNIEDPGPSALHAFADKVFNGLQKDPSREEANWEIAPKENAASISYAPTLKLHNHTDQSLPNHGVPALFLMMHTVQGFGVNTLVDTYAVCEALRERDPEAFDLLSRYGNPQCRFTAASRADAAQGHTVNLCILSGKPIIQLDESGNILRTQYNEVFRIPSELPFDVFKSWYSAYIKFGLMIHSKEFERRVNVQGGQIVIVNNWRVMHGRDGNWDGTHSNTIQSSDRVLTGGTVTRENMLSRARDLLQEVYGAQLYGTQLLS